MVAEAPVIAPGPLVPRVASGTPDTGRIFCTHTASMGRRLIDFDYWLAWGGDDYALGRDDRHSLAQRWS